MKEVTANRAAILGYLEPVCAIVIGAFFLGEEVRASTVVGGGMILFSGYLTVRGDREHTPPK
jgi:drug/metabolite transporter (DMT)-like permease